MLLEKLGVLATLKSVGALALVAPALSRRSVGADIARHLPTASDATVAAEVDGGQTMRSIADTLDAVARIRSLDAGAAAEIDAIEVAVADLRAVLSAVAVDRR